MVLYSKFAHGSQFLVKKNSLQFCSLIPEILSKTQSSDFFWDPLYFLDWHRKIFLLPQCRPEVMLKEDFLQEQDHFEDKFLGGQTAIFLILI